MCHVRVFTKPNGGKWSAHNYGLQHASGTLILCIDADSRIEAGALKLMVRHMRDKRVGAVSGQIRVRNRKSLLGLFQAFEYVLANGALRLSQGATGTVMVVPGPIGLFRREALDRVEAANKLEQRNEEQTIVRAFLASDFCRGFSPFAFHAGVGIQGGVRTSRHCSHQGSVDTNRPDQPAVPVEPRNDASSSMVSAQNFARR